MFCRAIYKASFFIWKETLGNALYFLYNGLHEEVKWHDSVTKTVDNRETK